MRILDKNTDFYDYFQNIYVDNTFTFDRRDSFVITKEMLLDNLHTGQWWGWKKRYYNKFNYILLQVCNTFWLFLIEFIKYSKDFDKVEDYNVELLTSWRNFDKPRKLCSLNRVSFHYFHDDTKEDVYKRIPDLIRDINTNNYKIKNNLDTHIIYNGDVKVTKTIPLLKACGLGNCIDPHEIYLAFEEYFSLEKSDSERREPIGTTDIDKVESHGFDKKISFRGK